MEVSKDNLESQLREKQRELDSLREEFNLFKQETVELEKELEADNEFKGKEIQSLTKKLETATGKSDEYKKEAVQLEKILDREKENSSKVKAELEAIKTQIVQLEQDNEALEVKARHVEFEKKEMKEKIDKLEERIIVERESLTEKFNKSVEELERLRKELEEHKEEVAVLHRKNIESSAGGLEEDKHRIEQQAEDIALLLEEIKGMEKKGEEKDSLIEELKRNIEELNGKIGGQEEVEALRKKVSEYEEIIKGFKGQNNDKGNGEGEENSKIVEDHAKEIEQLQQKLKSAEEQVKSKNSEIEGLKSEMKKKVSEHETTIKGLEEKNHVKKDDGEVEVYSKLIEQQAKEIEQLQQRLKLLEEQAEAKNAEIEDLKQAKNENVAPISGNNEEVEVLRKKLEESKEEVIALNKKMTEERNAANALLEAEKEKRSDQLSQIIDLQLEIERLQKQLKEKDVTIKEHKQNAANLAEQLEIKESEAAIEGATIENIKIELERLSQELEGALKEKSDLVRKAEQENIRYSEQFQSTQKEQERTKLEMDKEIICLRLELAQVKEELAALREENKKLKAEINTKQGKISSLEEEVVRVNLRMKKENEAQTKDLKAEVTKLKEENARLKKDNKSLKSKVSDKESGIDQLEEELYRMKKSIEEGKDQLIAIEKDLEVSRSEKSDILDKSPLAEEILLSPLAKTENNRWLSPELGRSLSQPLTQSLGLRSSSLSPVMEEVNRESSPEKKINPNQTVFKHLYTKIGKLGAPSYLVIDQENKEVKISKNSGTRVPGKLDKSLGFDTLLGRVSEMNLKENVCVSYEDTIEEQVLGKNLFYMIYGPKKTDKKKLKYRVLQDFADIFKGIAKRGEYAGKICKLMMRVQDNALNKKAELLRNTTLAHQLKSFGEFYLGYEKSERDLDDFLSQMKQVDTTPGKNVNNYSFAKIKAAPKQIFIEFSIENEGSYTDLTSKPTHGDSEEDGEDPNVNYSRLSDANLEGDESPQQQQPVYLARTKIMLLCTNGVKEENYFDNLNSVDSIIDLIMTDDRVAVAKKEKLMAGRPTPDNVVKHFLLTTYPTTQTYKNTFNTISLANKIEQVRKDKDSFDMPSPWLRHSRSAASQRVSVSKAETKYQMPIIKISSSPERVQERSSEVLDTEENEEVNKQLMYYTKKQQTMKKNMKNVLGMLNTLMVSDQEQGQSLRKSRDSSPNKTNNMTPKTGSQVNSRNTSPDKAKPKSKVASRGNYS